MKVEVTVVMRPEFSRPEYKIDEKYDGVFMNCVQIHDHCICPHCTPDKGKHDRLYP